MPKSMYKSTKAKRPQGATNRRKTKSATKKKTKARGY